MRMQNTLLLLVSLISVGLRAQIIGNLRIEGDVDLPISRLMEIVSIRVGDEFSEARLDSALQRLANTGRYKGVEGFFDSNDRSLFIQLSLLERLGQVEISNTKLGTDLSYTEDLLREDVFEVIGISKGDPIFLEQLGEIRSRIRNRLEDRGFVSPEVVLALEESTDTPGERNLLVSLNLGEREYIEVIELLKFRGSDLREFKEILAQQPGFADYLRALDVPDRLLDKPEEYLLRQFRIMNSRQEKDQSFKLTIPLDWVVINNAISQWSQKTRSRGYFDFKVDSRLGVLQNQRTLSIELARGPRYNVQFSGNIAFWERDLRSRVLDRTLKLGVPLNINEAQNTLQRVYQSAGFVDVSISTEVEDQETLKTIRFRVQEGRRYYLGNILWDGLSPDEIILVDPILKKWRQSISHPFHKIYFYEQGLQANIGNLVQQLRDEGYLDARILGMRSKKGDSELVDIEMPIQLGPKYLVRDIVVESPAILSDQELDKIVTLEPGTPAALTNILQLSQALLFEYQSRGFIFAKVSADEKEIISYSNTSNEVDLKYIVVPGPKVRVGQVVVEGLSKTKEQVVLREFEQEEFVRSKDWSPQKLERIDEKLLGSGLFGSLRFQPFGGQILSNDAKGFEVQERDLKVTLSERPAGAVEFGPGYRSDLGLIGFGELNYRNLGGWNCSVILRTQASRKLTNYQFIEQRHNLTFLEPYFLDYPNALRVTTQYIKADETQFENEQPIKGFNREEVSLSFSLIRELTDNFTLTQNLYSISRPRIFDIIDDENASRQIYIIGSVGTLLSYDTRNNIFNPLKGSLLSAQIEYASPFLGSSDDVDYIFTKVDANYYYPVHEGATLAIAANYSTLNSLGNVDNLPENKRLVLGGRNSIRSFGEGFLRFDAAGIETQSAWEAKFEYKQKFLEELSLALFYDFGEVSAGNFGSTDIRSALGVGARYATPVGPLALDWAFNPDPRENEDLSRIQFSVGVF